MIAHIGRTHGLHVGWSSTDGIYIDGELVEAGDYSGPSGAGRVLAHQEVQLAVTETARGGILLRGIGLRLQRRLGGHQRVRRPPGPARHRHRRPARRGQGRRPPDHQARRLGGAQRRRPAGLRDALRDQGQPWVFSRDPDSPALREVLNEGGRATTVIDGWICVLAAGRRPRPADRGRGRADDAGRAVAVQPRERAGGRLRSAGGRAAARGGRRGPAHLPARPEAQPRPDELLLPRRRHRRHRPRPQRGRPRGADRDHERRTPSAAPACCSALGAVGDRQDELVGSLGRDGRPRRRRGRRSRTRRSTCAAARPRSSTSSSATVLPASASTDVPSYPTEVDGLEALVARPSQATSSA